MLLVKTTEMKVILNTKKPNVKRIPMYKDPVYTARVKHEFIVRHNTKIQKMIDNGTYDKWIGR